MFSRETHTEALVLGLTGRHNQYRYALQEQHGMETHGIVGHGVCYGRVTVSLRRLPSLRDPRHVKPLSNVSHG